MIFVQRKGNVVPCALFGASHVVILDAIVPMLCSVTIQVLIVLLKSERYS